MTYLKFLALSLFTWALVACGGANGAGPIGNSVALYISAPNSVTLAAAASSSYMIGGGVAPYTASSGNSAVATVTLSGTALSITGVAAGTAQITVLDAAGKSVSSTVTVATSVSAASLYVTAPGAITLSMGTAQVFTIAGGVAPYLASSSNTAVTVANVLNGNALSIAGISAGGPAQVMVFDSTGKSVAVTVNVGAPGSGTALYTTAPAAITIGTVGTRSYSLGGGVGPYSAVSSNDSVATASIAGAALTINGIAAGTATVILRDAVNATVPITVTVGAAHAMFTTAPTVLTLGIGAAPSYAISAGAAPFVTSSSNTNVATAMVNGSNLTINAIAAGSANIIVLDSTGALVTVAVSVGAGSHVAIFSTVPAAITIATGATPSYAIGGGTAPYSATSSNTSVLSASVSGATLNLVGLAAGSANVVVRDAVGDIAGPTAAATTTSVTVTPVATTPLAVLPSASTANVGDVLNFSISGGSPAYSVTVNNPSIAAVTPSGNSSFTARLLNVGATTVAIVDQLGQTSTLSLTVSNASSLMRLSPSALQVGEDYAAPIALSIYGGTAPYTAYTAYTSDLQLSSVAVSGSQYTVSIGENKTRCINPLVNGIYSPYGTYDITLTVVDSLGASATSTLTIKDNGKGGPANGPPAVNACGK